MKIKGPTHSGPTPPPDAGEVDEAKRAGKAFSEALGETAKPGGPSGPSGADPVGQVAADLKAGRISPDQAVQRLVDLTIAGGPTAGLPARVQAKLRADLENLLREDPFLRAKLEKIGVPLAEDD